MDFLANVDKQQVQSIMDLLVGSALIAIGRSILKEIEKYRKQRMLAKMVEGNAENVDPNLGFEAAIVEVANLAIEELRGQGFTTGTQEFNRARSIARSVLNALRKQQGGNA